MSEAMIPVSALLAGALLGAMFFGGLWWTVRKGISSARPGLWFAGSLLLRMGLTLAGFYFVSAGQWQRLLLCLAGFLLARFIAGRLVGAPPHRDMPLAERDGPCT